MLTTVDLLRHGEVSGGSCYRGSTDDPLSKKGWQQMNNAVADQHWDQLICSPLHRCLDFAQNLSNLKKTPLTIEPDWQEICFGDWEGKTADQINSEELTGYYQDPVNNTPKNGESYLTFESRISQAWNTLITTHHCKHILIITHSGVIRTLFTILLNLPIKNIFKLRVDHASLTRFQSLHDGNEHHITLNYHNKLADQ